MKKAKFVIEIEYDDAVADTEDMVDRNIKVLNYKAEGDYKGLTLALTSGLAFATERKESNYETFKEKLRLLRATASALISVYGTLRRMKLLGEGDAAKEETEHILGSAIKRVIDYISTGLATALEISPSQMEEVNEEYKDIHDKNIKDGEDKQDPQGTDRIDFDDYL